LFILPHLPLFLYVQCSLLPYLEHRKGAQLAREDAIKHSHTKSSTYLEHRKGAQLAREDEIRHSQYEIKHLPGTQEGCPTCPGR